MKKFISFDEYEEIKNLGRQCAEVTLEDLQELEERFKEFLNTEYARAILFRIYIFYF